MHDEDIFLRSNKGFAYLCVAPCIFPLRGRQRGQPRGQLCGRPHGQPYGLATLAHKQLRSNFKMELQ